MLRIESKRFISLFCFCVIIQATLEATNALLHLLVSGLWYLWHFGEALCGGIEDFFNSTASAVLYF